MRRRVIEIAFRDMLMILVGMLVLMLLALLAHVHPDAKPSAPPPGKLIVRVDWPPVYTDVDLWVTGPGESLPVGYSRKNGKLWDLVRDDLGQPENVDGGVHHEDAFSRSVPDGRYTANLHLYRDKAGALPVTVRCRVGVAGDYGITWLLERRATLTHVGHEVTIWSWEMSNGQLLPESVDQIMRPLRTPTKETQYGYGL